MTRIDGNPGVESSGERFSNQYDVTRSERPSTASVLAVAEATGVEPTALPPLYETVDPDALDDLFRDPDGTNDVRVSFSYGGCDVVVEDGTVVVETKEE